jgi:uncharacterized membrane protein
VTIIAMEREDTPEQTQFSGAELGAIAHLYRGELYRSKIWRQRLDTTTNWAVALTGIALSITFSAANNTPAPLIVAGLVVFMFLYIEARRYRYFDIWRTRTRLLEVYFYGPMLTRQPVLGTTNWNQVLAQDMAYIHFHITIWEALGRRLRRNYAWLFGILGLSYLGKLLVHPIPGQIVVALGLVFYGALITVAVVTLLRSRAVGRAHPHTQLPDHDDPIMRMSI